MHKVDWGIFLQTSDTVGYDEYVEGVEPDETTSLETPIKEVRVMAAWN